MRQFTTVSRPDDLLNLNTQINPSNSVHNIESKPLPMGNPLYEPVKKTFI